MFRKRGNQDIISEQCQFAKIEVCQNMINYWHKLTMITLHQLTIRTILQTLFSAPLKVFGMFRDIQKHIVQHSSIRNEYYWAMMYTVFSNKCNKFNALDQGMKLQVIVLLIARFYWQDLKTIKQGCMSFTMDYIKNIEQSRFNRILLLIRQLVYIRLQIDNYQWSLVNLE